MQASNALLLLFLALLVSAFLLPTSYHRAALQHSGGQVTAGVLHVLAGHGQLAWEGVGREWFCEGGVLLQAWP